MTTVTLLFPCPQCNGMGLVSGTQISDAGIMVQKGSCRHCGADYIRQYDLFEIMYNKMALEAK
jgi:hypothetical protein